MNKFKQNIVLMSAILCVAMLGCGERAQDSKAAIELSKAKTTVEAQAKYLIQQANSFIRSKNFDEAIKTAKYVLSKLDSKSVEAKNIIEKATAELKILADKKVAEAKGKLKSFGQ